MYSILDVLLNAIPVAERGRLVYVASTDPRAGQAQAGTSGGVALTGVSEPDLLDWGEQAVTVEQFAGFRFGTATLTSQDGPARRVRVVRATANLLQMWGIQPVLGRGFLAEDGRLGAAPVVMLTDALWRREFAASATVLNLTLRLDDRPHAVIGVLPPELSGGIFGTSDLIVAHTPDPRAARDERRLFVTARLREGASRDEAAAELRAIGARLQVAYPRTNAEIGVAVRPLMEMLGGSTPFLLGLLVLIGGFVVALACANVANLRLAQASARHRERSLHAVLGATRAHHFLRSMTENALIAGLAGAAGLFVAWWSVDLVSWLSGTQAPGFSELRLTPRVLLAGVLTSLVTPLVFGAFPALRSSEPDPLDLRNDARVGTMDRGRVRAGLMAVQVALAMVLMVQVGLIARTALRLGRAPSGFEAGQLLTFRVELPEATYSEGSRIGAFASDVLSRLERLPGVLSTGAINRLPIADREVSVRVRIDGAPQRPLEALPFAGLATISRDYVPTMQIPLLRGRGLVDADFGNRPAVALVSEQAAREFWPNRDPIGARLQVVAPTVSDDPFVVVGVVGDVRNPDADRRATPQIYVPFTSHPDRAIAFVVRTPRGNPLQLVQAIRAEVAEVDSRVPVFDASSMSQVLWNDLAGTFTLAAVLGAIALVSLCVAAAGVYGVVAYAVAQRTREIGVRMALGARPGAVLRMVIGHSAVPVAAGGIVGLLVAFALAAALATAATEVTSGDPLTYVTVVALLGLSALAASYLPARRASRIDPIEALRAD